MAGGAGGRESCRYMIRIGYTFIYSGVAGIAVLGSSRELIIDMAQGALHRGVRAGKREPRIVVIECGIGPGSGVVALGARLRET